MGAHSPVMNIEPADVEFVELGPAVLMRGYLYQVRPGAEALREVEMEDEDGRLANVAVGFGEDECPPSSGDCLAQTEDGGYIIISELDDVEQLATLDGWSLAPVTLPDGWRFEDPSWKVTLVARQEDGQCVVAGYRPAELI